MRRTLTTLILLTLFAAVTLLAQDMPAPSQGAHAKATQSNSAQGPAVGTWKLNLQKSDFGKMPPPKSVTVTVTEDTPTSLKWRAAIVDDKDKRITESFVGAPDGKDYPVKGSENAETIAYTNENGVIKATGKTKDGTTIQQTITMADDHNSMTLNSTASGPNGEMSWTEVLERVGHRAEHAPKSAPAKP